MTALCSDAQDPDTTVQNSGAVTQACDITVIILTFNEERHLKRAIASVQPFAKDVLVVDSFSTDKTVEIANSLGARVMQRRFINQAEQFNWALDNGGVSTGWIMRLDADEIIGEDLTEAIRDRIDALSDDITGVIFERKHIFMGKWVRFGGRFPLPLLRLWRTGEGRVEQKWMDEHVVVRRGRTITLKGTFEDRNDNDLSFFTAKHNAYATREAIEVLIRRYGLTTGAGAEESELNDVRNRLKRWIKVNLYERLPLSFGPLCYFLFRYIFQLGFLDGRSGTIYHVLQGFWYRYLVACKIYELERGIARDMQPYEIVEFLSDATGFDLVSQYLPQKSAS